MINIDLERLKIGKDHYININDFQNIIKSYIPRSGYVETYVVLKNIFQLLEEAKMSSICDDCGQETYCIYPVGKDKLVCDICYDKKYRCKECKKDKKFCGNCDKKL